MIAKSEVRKEIIARGCAKCSESVDDAESFILTFCRGEFIVLHNECADFIEHATKGPRVMLNSGQLKQRTVKSPDA